MKQLLIVLCLVSSAYTGVFLNSFVQKGFNTHGKTLSYSIGYCFKTNKTPFSYYEAGITILPSINDRLLVKTEKSIFSKSYTKSFYGTYGAGYFFLLPIFRPGIIFGGGVVQKELWRGSSKNDLQPSEISDSEFMPYYGLSAHIGMLSVVYTNLGFGIGVNIQFN
jgi:hypothetical protein